MLGTIKGIILYAYYYVYYLCLKTEMLTMDIGNSHQAGTLFSELCDLWNPQTLSEVTECSICKIKYHYGNISYTIWEA